MLKDKIEADNVEPKAGRVNIDTKYNGNKEDPKVMRYCIYYVVPSGDLDSWKYPHWREKHIVDGWNKTQEIVFTHVLK